MSVKIISIVVIAAGLIIEFATAGSQIGNMIASVGVVAFVYDYFKRRQGPRG